VLDPYLSAWVKKQGDAILFKRVPVVFNDDKRLELLSKLYYTLEAMGKIETLHPKIFEALHVKRLPLNTTQQIVNFVASNGVDKTKFEEVFNSFAIATKVRRAIEMVKIYNVDSVPKLFVDGRYMTSPALVMQANPTMSEVQSEQGLMLVLSALVRKVEDERKKAAVPKVEKAQPLKK
jgi:thiol:disulfide interchange protein DsbA